MLLKKRKICNLFAVNTALNDRVEAKCTQCSLHVCSDMCGIGIYIYVFLKLYHEKLSCKYRIRIYDVL